MNENEQKPAGRIGKRRYEKPTLVLLSDPTRVEGKTFSRTYEGTSAGRGFGVS
ncbi:hypothetical protein [uncultured Parasphingorhabdus sp.]|uniref:hypothetical protein n=1 Tax=uncultured Parasphingorhabdus sp. TaxID=2709694 RepID=UPI002AA6A17B|nr:hypothetical protein [uncultured Parasphingorhabdus sp.]